jgi:beta-galactosidase GanA
MYKAAVAEMWKIGHLKAGHIVRMRLLRLWVGVAVATSFAAAGAQQLPRLAEEQGRATLMVDGAPYFLLGAQVDNSSGWPERLEAVWPAAARMRLNTLEVPVYWEQMEPERGYFDFSVVDALVAQAREHHVRLVLLWFATWKNGKMHYVPSWVKADTVTYPRMLTQAGKPIDVLSPNAPANLDADRTAFVALMKHLRETDARHTVIMMQVENESGSLGSVRDFSPLAQKQFEAQVPAELLRALGKQPGAWQQVFGDDADETFAAWSVASYIGQVAAAGKRELALPMYANNWLKSPRAYPISTIPGDDYPSGGPTINMHPVWKVAAPSLDLLAPDIYVPSSERYRSVMNEFHTVTNPLLIPESLGFEPFPGASGYARYLYYAVGAGAIGFANFGLDRVKLDAPDAETISQIEGFRLLGSFDRELAALEFAGKVKTAVEEPGIAEVELDFGPGEGGWRAVAEFPASAEIPATVAVSSDTKALHVGRVVIASLGKNQFLVAGIDCRVHFATEVHSHEEMQLVKVEEGRFDGTTFIPGRLWNGDETDNGLNFGGKGSVLRVTLGSF